MPSPEEQDVKRHVFSAPIAISVLLTPSTALAVGDPPVNLSRKEATTVYQSIRPFLNADGLISPSGQAPVSGRITGGSSPMSGGQTITIIFNKGGWLVINKNWTSLPAPPTVNLQVTCGSAQRRL